jgi:hypothetical protein
LRSPSQSTASPPASSICIISDVPDRGSPETIVIIYILQRNNIGKKNGVRRHQTHKSFTAYFKLPCAG